MKGSHAFALVAVGVLLGLALAPRREAAALPAAPAAPHGVVLENGRVRFVDLARWQAFVRETLPEAERDGVRGPDGVLTYMLRRALPGSEWPPPEEDEQARAQWDRMVAAAGAALTTGELAAPARFEVVR